MRLYTLQPHAALETLLAGENFRADPDLSRKDGFLQDDNGQIERAYSWLAHQLAALNEPPCREALPVWVWHTFGPVPGKPDLRRHRPYAPGVLLVLDIDPARVLLSDFDLWHAPLNGNFLGTEQKDTAFDLECQRRGISGYGEFWQNSQLADTVLKSWEHCLDLDWYAPGWFGVPRERKKIQGVLWETGRGIWSGTGHISAGNGVL